MPFPGSKTTASALVALLGSALQAAAGEENPILEFERRLTVGRTPSRIAFGDRTDDLFVSCAYETSVVRFALGEDTPEEVFRERLSPISPLDVVCLPGEQGLIIANYAADSVHWLDAATGKAEREVHLEFKPVSLALSPDGKLLAVGCDRSQAVYFLQPSSGKVQGEAVILNGPPGGLCFDAGGSTLYAVCGGPMAGVAKVSRSGAMEHQEYPVQPGTELQVSRDGKQLFLCGKDALLIADARRGGDPQSHPLDGSPRHLLLIRRGRHLVALLPREEKLLVIDPRRGSVDQIVEVAEQPYGMALSADGKRLAVAERSAGTVSLFRIVR
jgi:DNA-binding beta-propeller fold protein YncE